MSVLFLTGCYNRWTANYMNLPEATDMGTVDLETVHLTPEEQAKREKVLRELMNAKDEAYTINAGDKLEITVYNHPDLSVKTVVTPDGNIGMVLVGQLCIARLTLQEATQKIEQALSKYIRNPKVGISPFEIASETATISGAVTRPGIYPITNDMRLADLFAKAGGASSRYFDGQTLQAADYPNSIFIRRNQIIPLNFEKAIDSGDPLHNVRLRRGDYIFIAARENSQVYLVGDVRRPGRQVLTPNMGVMELLSSGGWTNDTCWSHAIIIRGGLSAPSMFKVDMDAILRGDKQNVALHSGDIVYVPKDDIAEYNVFVRKLMPTAQLINMIFTPATWIASQF
ncbi:MAG: polysaccharide biosynthesis/export family protein [Lentisphaeria bacterium]|nr:polysaccharide biosynthesis/export family protein [Lentisphaeria bacterium]